MTSPKTEGRSLPGELLHAAPSTEAAVILEAAERLQPIHLPEIGIDSDALGVPRKVLVVREGFHVHPIKPFLDAYLTAPERRKGRAVFTDLASFIVHAKRFADVDSVVFANDAKAAPSLTSVLDYHRQTATGSPRFGEHRGHYAFPLSDEWAAWTKQSGKPMDQTDFAQFLEDRLADVADPEAPELMSGSVAAWASRLGLAIATPSKLLELSRGLDATSKQTVRGAHDVGSGATTISFASEHSDPNGQPLNIPGGFAIAIPVFRRGNLYPMPVRLRFRIKETVTWSFELARVDAIFENAIAEALDDVAEQTSLPVLRGAAEV